MPEDRYCDGRYVLGEASLKHPNTHNSFMNFLKEEKGLDFDSGITGIKAEMEGIKLKNFMVEEGDDSYEFKTEEVEVERNELLGKLASDELVDYMKTIQEACTDAENKNLYLRDSRNGVYED